MRDCAVISRKNDDRNSLSYHGYNRRKRLIDAQLRHSKIKQNNVDTGFGKSAEGAKNTALPFHSENVIFVLTELSTGESGGVRVVLNEEDLNRQYFSGTTSVDSGFRAG